MFLASRSLLVDAVEDMLDIIGQISDQNPIPAPPKFPAPAMRRDIAWSVMCEVMDRRRCQPDNAAVGCILNILTSRPFDHAHTYSFF